jgi:VanZ family protein
MPAFLRWLLVACWISTMFALSSIPSLPLAFAHSSAFAFRTLAHIGEYAVLTALLCWASHLHVGSKVRAWLFAALVATLYGLSDEWYQSWLAGGYGSFSNLGIDALGIAASYALAHRRPHQGMTATWQCPKCQAMRVYRSRRRGRLEWCSRLICLAPFRCDICSHRFWHFTRRDR